MGDYYDEPFGPEAASSDASQTQIFINRQQAVVNQQLLDQISSMQDRLNDVYKWVINHETTHANKTI
jgi:hypothetical protein